MVRYSQHLLYDTALLALHQLIVVIMVVVIMVVVKMNGTINIYHCIDEFIFCYNNWAQVYNYSILTPKEIVKEVLIN